MELDELQAVWSEMSNQLDKQKKLTSEIILKMTHQQYRNRMNKVKYPEILGGLVCLVTAVLIIYNFQDLDTWPLRICGAISLMIMIILPIFSFRAIKHMDRINVQENNYKQTLVDFAKGKRQFLLAQKISVYLGFALLIVVLPVFSKLMNGKDILSEVKIWIWYLPFGFLFFVFFTIWVIKHYKNTLNDTTQILADLEQED